jgi:hypothetical protein
LTRDPALIDHPALTHAYHVKESEAERQLEEVLLRLDLGATRPGAPIMADLLI